MGLYFCLPILAALLSVVDAFRPRPDPSVLPFSARIANRAISESEDGFNNGYFYSYWADAPGLANYTNGDGGSYTLEWNGYNNQRTSGWVIAGKGWNPGSERVIKYNGTYDPIGDTMLCAYRWAFEPLVQYYVVESYNVVDPSEAGTRMGTTTCNGATYTISRVRFYDRPTSTGNQVLDQYWSVREPTKPAGGVISGEIDIACHFSAWRGYGMKISSEHYYQILAVDAFRSR